MSVSLADVQAFLDSEEPNYGHAAALGAEALSHLQHIVVNSEDPLLASKAAYLATIIPHEAALNVLEAAVSRPEPQVRVAAAAGVENLMGSVADAIDPSARAAFQRRAGELLAPMLADQDYGVRKAAERSLKAEKTVEAVTALREVAATTSGPARSAMEARIQSIDK